MTTEMSATTALVMESFTTSKRVGSVPSAKRMVTGHGMQALPERKARQVRQTQRTEDNGVPR